MLAVAALPFQAGADSRSEACCAASGRRPQGVGAVGYSHRSLGRRKAAGPGERSPVGQLPASRARAVGGRVRDDALLVWCSLETDVLNFLNEQGKQAQVIGLKDHS